MRTKGGTRASHLGHSVCYKRKCGGCGEVGEGDVRAAVEPARRKSVGALVVLVPFGLGPCGFPPCPT